MQVLKFGGTSVGSPERIKEVAKLITTKEPKIVVLSAMTGTTNKLVEIAQYLYKGNKQGAQEAISLLEEEYKQVVDKLFNTEKYKAEGQQLIRLHFQTIREFTHDMFTPFEERSILAEGELISTALMHLLLLEQEIESVLLPALDFMRITEDAEPNTTYIKEQLDILLKQYPDTTLFITQGFICRNAFGEIDNLQRGGSDYTASLIGEAINASEIQIWTDIDGMHNSDPRFVENTKPVSHLSFDEAAELAYFGAKILHPTSVLPAKLKNIPVRLLNTMCPSAQGTTISSRRDSNSIKAVAAKDHITAIRIKSARMLLAYGFLRKIFEIFENFKTPIDMISTSEVGVSLTIDNNKHLQDIVDELKKFGIVNVDYEQVIICIVGDFSPENSAYTTQVMQAIKDIPIRMISYGGSAHNLSLLIGKEYKHEALNRLSKHLF